MSETRDTLELRLVPLRTVQRWDRNAKKHDLGALAESIARHGFRDPPSYDQALNGGAGGIVEGNGRADALAAMRAQGMPAPRGVRDTGDDWLVPVLFGLDSASQHAAEAYAITHNNLTMAGGDFTDLDMAGMWEHETYAAVLEELAQAGETPITVDESALDALLAALRAPVEPGGGGDDFDATPEDGPTRCQPGDLWLIDGGRHRLICGDSTDAATVARLMGGERLRLIVTDPPYGVSYADKNRYLNAVAPANRIQIPILNDHGDVEEVAERLWRPAFATMYDAAERGCSLYCFMPQGGDQMMMMMMMMSAHWPPRHELIWLKNNHVLGRADYAYKHEPIVYAWKDEGHKFYGGFQVSVLAFDKPQKSDLHPTTKPLDLIAHLITNSSAPAEIVGDWFLGSGTTLIAAHRTGRRCYGVELSPHYCDVILRRAEAEGLTVERANA